MACTVMASAKIPYSPRAAASSTRRSARRRATCWPRHARRTAPMPSSGTSRASPENDSARWPTTVPSGAVATNETIAPLSLSSAMRLGWYIDSWR